MSMPFTNLIGSQKSFPHVMNQPLVLNEGQLIHGQIRQLFPGQLAEVQIGDQKMIAKLDVPMRAGDSYYFQVSSIQPDIQLKIISGPTNAGTNSTGQIQNLIEAMQLPKSPEMTQLLAFIVNNKLPITREGLLQAVQLLQATPATNQQEALQSIQKLLEIKLPLTQNFFRSIMGVETKEGLHSVMQSFTNALQNDQSVAPQTKVQLLQLLKQLERPVGGITGNAVLGESLKVLVDDKQNPSLRFAVLQLLKDTGLLPRTASLPNLQTTLLSNVAEQMGIPPLIQGGLSSQHLGNVTQLLNDLPFLTTGQKESLLTVARSNGMQPFVGALMQVIGESLANQPGKIDSFMQQKILSLLNTEGSTNFGKEISLLLQNAEKTTKPELQRLLQSAEATTAATLDGKVMKEAMQTIFRSLGVNYEAAMLGKDVQPERLAQMLKPQLLAMLNDTNITPTLREAAEQFVVRMNGSLLLSAENGGNHQLIMQLPLAFFGKKMDATLQWNGRMKEDGKIDADFARVFFYLNLHSLEETAIDMQVQNRIVTVTVFNVDQTLQTIAQPLQEKLKTGLSAIGYTLSGVSFKDFKEEKAVLRDKFQKYEGRGVDLRI